MQPLTPQRLLGAENDEFSLFDKSAKAGLCARAGRDNRERQNVPPRHCAGGGSCPNAGSFGANIHLPERQIRKRPGL